MKQASNLFQRTFTVDPTVKHTPTFEEYVNKTSKLIKRDYITTFKLVEDWAEHKIIARYKYCTEEFISMKNRAKAEMSEWLKTANGKKFLASQY